MRRAIVPSLIALLLSCGAVAAQNNVQPILPGDDISIVSISREQSRVRVIPYQSAHDALAGDMSKSGYIQMLNGEWRVKTNAYTSKVESITPDTANWAKVQIPEKEAVKSSETIYVRRYKRPFTWVDKEIFLHIGMVDSPYSVYANGKLCGYNQNGKVAAEFNLTKASVEGNNTLAIVVHGDSPVKALSSSNMGHTQLGGDIYMVAQPKIRVRDYVANTEVDGKSGLLNLGIIVKSHLLNPKDVIVHYELCDPDGKQVSLSRKEAKFEMKLEDTVRFFVNLPEIKVWNHETPNLYTLRLKTQHEGRYMEYIAFRFGFRSVAVDNDNILINGSKFRLDISRYTPSYDTEKMRQDLLNIKKDGGNCIIINEHPAYDSFYDLCDKLGLYVCDQADIASRSSDGLHNNPAYEQLFTDRVTGMYHASKNHSSVVAFSLAQNTSNGYNMYESYLALKNLEPDRPIFFAGANSHWNSDLSDNYFELPAVKMAKDRSIISYSAVNPAAGQYMVSNRYELTTITNLEYVITSKGKEIDRGVLQTFIAPGGKADVTIPMGKLKWKEGMAVIISLPNTSELYMRPTPSEQVQPETWLQQQINKIN